MLRIAQPIRAIGYKGPSPHLSDACGQRIEIPIDPVEFGQMPGEPVFRDMSCPYHESIDRQNELGMGAGDNFR